MVPKGWVAGVINENLCKADVISDSELSAVEEVGCSIALSVWAEPAPGLLGDRDKVKP
jgi:hypothetical protein